MVTLYIWDRCPFCIKVVNAAAQMGLEEDKDYHIVDGSPGSMGRLEVEAKGGKGMVPFLVDGDVSMYESDDIISYLQKKFSS